MYGKWNKSRYRCKNSMLYRKIILCVTLCATVGLMYMYRECVVYNIGYICLNGLSAIYFLCRYFYIKANLKNNNLELTPYSKRIYNIHKGIITICLLIMLVINIYLVCNIYDGNYKIYIWYGIILPMLYGDSVYLSGITAFGEKYFASGEYLIKYDDIEEIKVVTEKDTIRGQMVLITLYRNGKEYGYDKLFVEEYHKLRLKVFQNM